MHPSVMVGLPPKRGLEEIPEVVPSEDLVGLFGR